MIRFKSLYLLGGLATATLSAETARFDSLIASDTDMVISIRNTTELSDSLETNPLGQFWSSAPVQRFLESFSQGAVDAESENFFNVMESRFGLDKVALLELFPGQISIAVDDMFADLDDAVERTGVLVMAEFSGDEARMNELMQIQFEYNAEAQKAVNPAMEHVMIEKSFMGETIYYDEAFNGETTYIEDGYALIDGIFILGAPESALEGLVEAIKSGRQSNLDTLPSYQRSFEGAEGETDLSLFVNLESLLAPAIESMRTNPTSSAMAMMGLTSEGLLDALELDLLDAFALDFSYIPEGVSFDVSLLYKEQDGLLNLLAYGDGLLPDASFVPTQAVASSVGLFDFGAFWAAIEGILAKASPNLAQMLNLQLLNLQSQTGVDLRASFFQNLGQSIVSFSLLDETASSDGSSQQPAQIFMLEVKDSALLEQGIDALFAQIPQLQQMMQAEEFAEYTVHSYRSMEAGGTSGGQDISYTITRSKLIVCVGSLGNLKQALTFMEAPPAESYWERSDIESAFARFDAKTPFSRGAYDMDTFVETTLDQLMVLQSSGQLPDADWDALRDMEFPFLVVSESNQESDGLFIRTRLIEKEAP